MSIDWSAPIEAVHEDGRVEAVSLTEWKGDEGLQSGPDKQGDWYTNWPFEKGPAIWRPNGFPWLEMQPGWCIRNVDQHRDIATLSAPSPSEVGPEVVERMIACLRAAAAVAKDSVFGQSGYASEARAIVALLPEPVDALEQVIADAMCGNDVQPFEVANAIRNSPAALRALEKEAGR